MKKIVYIHGLSSSGNSRTAQSLQKLLPHCEVIAPDLPIDPWQALELLDKLSRETQPDLLIGTSMGGMFAQQLRGYKKILINPSFHVSKILRSNIGTQRFLNKRADGQEHYEITEAICVAYEMMEKAQFANITESEKSITWGMFALNDTLVDGREEYRAHYQNYIAFEGEHRLSPQNTEEVLIPLINKILS